MEHRTAIVTGGSGGSAWPSSAALAAAGWRVVTDGRDAATLRSGRSAGSTASPPSPATSPTPPTAPSSSAAAGGPIDLVVNNAGGLGPSPLPALADYPLDALAELFDVNVVAPLGVDPGGPAAPGDRGAVDRRHHVRRRRSRPTRAGAATAPRRPRSTTSAGCSPSSGPSCGCSRSTPATCAPRCTRTPSPARTSPTARCPRPACRRSWP